MATLYRCRTPTDRLCPCGRVARELRRHGLEADEVRVAWRGRDRDEVRTLTGQQKVPVVVLDGEAICDSHRIVEHLRWRQDAQDAAVSDR
jgi:glutathione S-transferase